MKNIAPRSLVVFSDLDGCLLNEDYSHKEAEPALARLKRLQIPLVLASSKTAAEMLPIAEELETPYPLICENGGSILWRGYPHKESPAKQTILGVPRETILDRLRELKNSFRFRSYETLGIAGIMERTGLTTEKAKRSADRKTTEPLVWDDDEKRLDAFRQEIAAAGLTLTRGGRFWHIAGKTSKGAGLIAVLKAMSAESDGPLKTIALGDSPIDLSLLEAADFACVIPGPDGEIRIRPDNPQTHFASSPGAAGWNSSINRLLDSIVSDS